MKTMAVKWVETRNQNKVPSGEGRKVTSAEARWAFNDSIHRYAHVLEIQREFSSVKTR